jgi:isoleucyl-tRNA synthetase
MFKPVPPALNIIQMEEGVLRTWKHRRIFEKSKALRREARPFVIYPSPGNASAKPGAQHFLAAAYQDLFERYKTMNGFRAVLRGGWDTHGLTVEYEVEKQLGLNGRLQIEEFGIDRFNARCRGAVFTYVQDWEKLTDRNAFWADLEDAYVTYTNDYVESVWWILKSLWDREALYQAFKIVPCCPRCSTALSHAEVSVGSRETVEPSMIVRMPLVDDPGTSLLVWTSAPWSLLGNVAVAAHPHEDYAIVERPLPEGGRERLILARSRLSEVFQGEQVEVYESFKGGKLKDLRYHPLFTYLLPEKKSHFVILGDFVDMEEGTGLLHLAPALGEVDLEAALEYDLPILHAITQEGTFVPEIRPWSGKFFKEADPYIGKDLDTRGLLYKTSDRIQESQFCPYCDTPILFSARSAWHIRTAQAKDQLVALSQQINWLPKQANIGRFSPWLEDDKDWILSRERFWATPLPIWECKSCLHQLAVGSIEELSGLAGQDLSDLDLHRPQIDEIHFPCPECRSQMQRIPEVVDSWFDSGAMPLAQWHYPFENQEAFQEQFPADLICDAQEPANGWLYALHVVNGVLSEAASFKNALVLGSLLDDQGLPLSSFQGNSSDPWEVINLHGSDALRWRLYTAGPAGEARRFSADQAAEVIHTFTLPLWNAYHFFVAFARAEGWRPGIPLLSPLSPEGDQAGEAGQADALLDRWLISELHTLVRQVSTAYEDYDVPAATRPIQTFVAHYLSGWYLQRGRRRFLKNVIDGNKNAAFEALYETLVTLSRLLAPAMPLLAEELYQNLLCSLDPQAPESVHFTDWPGHDASKIDPGLNDAMALVIKIASLGQAARNKAGIKAWQPLSEMAFALPGAGEVQVLERHFELLMDALNVKHVRTLDPAAPLPGLMVVSEGEYQVALNRELTAELREEGLAGELIHQILNLRQEAGFDLADRVRLYLHASPRLTQILHTYRQTIQLQTLVEEISTGALPENVFFKKVVLGSEPAEIGMDKEAG